jgi:hypothetical protein
MSVKSETANMPPASLHRSMTLAWVRPSGMGLS